MDLPRLSFGNVIDGKLQPSAITVTATDPRTQEPLWPIPAASERDLNLAVTAAGTAFQKWSKVSIQERQKAVHGLVKVLEDNREMVGHIVSRETGKSHFMGDLEVEHSLGFLRFNASQDLPDEVVFEDDTVQISTTYVPLGVVGAICPWNFPLILATAKIAAALVTGNCIIVKPSPFTPYSIMKFAELATDILPPGVFQVLNGSNEIGASMTCHPNIQKISFTGSTKTGKIIMKSCAGTLKRITLELGGNDASIVLPDVDVDSVATEVAAGCFFNSGQMCVATKRVYVHERIYDPFLRKFLEAVRALPFTQDPGVPTVLGPVQNKLQYGIVQNIIQDCKQNNYKFALGGSDIQSGQFIAPCVVDNPPDDSLVVQEEQFGPIIPLLKWSSEDELLRRANNTKSGLGACVWAKDLREAKRIGSQIHAGSVWLNSFEKPHPYGYLAGHKESGVGGEWGKQGLLSYCDAQTFHAYKGSKIIKSRH
ncbi:aldehyde dehydrogenase domain-containing protein [Aspergillus cavernicola]|uniref:aldehyde dehydrogenase (NAD(+)) n=1 Tax=Aspergillus cavernicola TaxID=176166 RepID=A0ABR4IHV2_9EURO